MLNAYCVKRKLWVDNEIVFVSDPYIELLDEQEVEEKKKMEVGADFDSLWNFLKAGNYCGGSLWKRGFFSKKRHISFDTLTIYEGWAKSWRYEVEVYKWEDLRLYDLKRMPADKVIRYCAERGAAVNL